MKLLLALIVVVTASHIVYDRAYQHHNLQQSPEITQCQFVPVISYGVNIKLRGYFESGKCCRYGDPHC